MSGFAAGQTGLIVAVPAAEPVVGPARSAYDTSAPYGVPAHVTVLFPFLPFAEVDAETLAELDRICSTLAAFDVTFAEGLVRPGLPVTTRVERVDLIAFDGSRWTPVDGFSLG